MIAGGIEISLEHLNMLISPREHKHTVIRGYFGLINVALHNRPRSCRIKNSAGMD